MLSWFHVMSLILLMLVAALAPSKIIFLVFNISIKFTVFLRAGNSNIFFGLSLRALSAISVCRLLGKKRSRLMLHRMAFFFDLRIPLHAAMWALFLVAFFSFLRNSNLVVKNMRSVSSVKVLRCSHLILNENTAFLRILATKTIQFAQRSLIFHCQLSLDLFCAQSPLCIHISSCIRCPLVLHSFPFAPAIESRFKPLLIHSFRVFWLGPYKLSGQIPVNFPLIAFGAGGRLSLLIAVFQRN